MSIFKHNQKNGSPLKNLVAELGTMFNERGAEFSNSNTTNSILTLESMNQYESDNLNQTAKEIQDSLTTAFESIVTSQSGLGTESLSISQMEAGVMAALASGNPLKYSEAALNTKVKTANGVNVINAESSGQFGTLDFRDSASMEAFDQRAFDNMIPYSIAFNVQASRQDEFSETFYPTSVVSPENGGMDIQVDFTTVFNHVKRSAKGQPTDFNQKNLLEAAVDATILEDESTSLVPFRNPDDSNASNFTDPTLVAPFGRVVAGTEVMTAPLAPSKEIDLIGISGHPGLLGSGVLDNNDALDTRVFLRRLYLASDWDDGTNTGTDVMSFAVDRLPYNAFIDSIEGHNRSMLLNFRSNVLLIDSALTNLDGSVPQSTATARTNNFTIQLDISVTGNLNLEFGTVRVLDAGVSVAKIIDVDGNAVSMASGTGLAVVTALQSIRLAGYELTAARTNTNRRTRGLLLNNVSTTERFGIPLGAPISAPSPIGSDRDTRDLESLITAARLRNSNNAVTTLLNYSATLKAYVNNRSNSMGSLNIEGIGRHVVTPFYEEVNLDLTTALNSIRSKDRADDVSSALINTIRDVVYRMYRDSGYQAALDASNTGGKVPTLVVGTDSVIQRHLMVEGDPRTFGVTFQNSKIVHSLDSRMRDRIILTFTRDGNSGTPDPLSFGAHGWIPELTSSMAVSRDGSTYQEAMVHPRSRHINNLPIMAIINVTGLDQVMISKIAP